MRMELRHLRILSEVEESGSIRRAARTLRVAQPALTTQIRRIEQALGGEVFTRTRDGVRLTELGRYVIGAGRDVLADFDRLIADTSALAHQVQEPQPLRLASMADLDVATTVFALAELLPGAGVTVREEMTLPRGVQLLHTGEADLALLFVFPGAALELAEGIVRQDIVPVEPALLAMPASHPLADLDEIPLAELADESWIVGRDVEDSGRERLFRRACERSGFTPRVRHRAFNCAVVLPLVRRGDGIALVHPLCVPPPDIVFRPLAQSPVHRSVILCWRRDSEVHAQGPALVRRLKEAYGARVAGRPVYHHWWQTHGEPLPAELPDGMPEPAPCIAPVPVRAA